MSDSLALRRTNRTTRARPYGARPQGTSRLRRSQFADLDQVQRRFEQLNRSITNNRPQRAVLYNYTSNINGTNTEAGGISPLLLAHNPSRLKEHNPFILALRDRMPNWLQIARQGVTWTELSQTSTTSASTRTAENQNQNIIDGFRWATMFPASRDDSFMQFQPEIRFTRTDGNVLQPALPTTTSSSVENNTSNETSPLSQQQTTPINYPPIKTEDKQILPAKVAVFEDIVDSFGADGLLSNESDDVTDEEEQIFQKVLEKKIKCDFCMMENKKYRCYKCFYSMCEECTDSLPRPHPWSVKCPQCKEGQNGFLHIRLPRF